MLPSAFLRLHRWLPPSLVFLQESRGYFCPAVRVSGQIDWKQDSPPGTEGGGHDGLSQCSFMVAVGVEERERDPQFGVSSFGSARRRGVQQVRLLWICAAHKHKPGLVIFGTAQMHFFLNFIHPDCCFFPLVLQAPIIPVVFSSYSNFYLRKEKQFKSGDPADDVIVVVVAAAAAASFPLSVTRVRTTVRHF